MAALGVRQSPLAGRIDERGQLLGAGAPFPDLARPHGDPGGLGGTGRALVHDLVSEREDALDGRGVGIVFHDSVDGLLGLDALIASRRAGRWDHAGGAGIGRPDRHIGRDVSRRMDHAVAPVQALAQVLVRPVHRAGGARILGSGALGLRRLRVRRHRCGCLGL